MSRHWIFRHYHWISLIAVAIGIGAVLRFAPADQMALIGSVLATVLAFCYFVQQQKLAETALFKDLFTEFNRRYDAMNDRLAQIAASQDVDPEARQAVVDYFNLCAEEYLFYSEGYIHKAAWRSWCHGMLWYINREPFKAWWKEEIATGSHYGLSLEEIRRGAA